MSTTTVPDGSDTTTQVASVEIPDRAQMLRIIAEAVAGGLPAPGSIDLFLHPSSRHVDLRLDDNRPEDVDAWMRAVSADGENAASLSSTLHTGGRAWRAYNYGKLSRTAVWHGWDFSVWSAIDEQTTPEAGTR